ncbi:MAG: iron ABC transporter permease [Hyphomicrobiaceae bacterium]
MPGGRLRSAGPSGRIGSHGPRRPPTPSRLLAGLRRWRARRRISPGWTIATALILLVILFPLASILVIALGPAGGVWRHLATTILPATVGRTLILLGGVGVVTLVIGTATAWLVALYRFPGRDLVGWLLLVPLAMPTYIIAYCYMDLLDAAGPIQTFVRWLLGFETRRQYWVPELRSIGGAVFVLSAVLYPYVYMSARASFMQQSVGTLEVARTLGRSALATFFEIALPLARPALAAGLALVLMECLNDIGATEYLGVRTLTVTAYQTWLQRSSLAGAAQIASVMLLFVLVLFWLEHQTRRGGTHENARRIRTVPERDLTGWRGHGALAVCLMPFLIGFVLPMTVLASTALRHLGDALGGAFLEAAVSSLVLALAAAFVTALVALVVAYARRVAPNGLTRPAVALAGVGYALPGTVLAIGLLVPLAAFDNRLDLLMSSRLGISTGLLLSGSVFAVILAYAIRFAAVAVGAIDSGLRRISPSLDAAARTLGESAVTTFRRLHFPLLKPTIGVALVLVFVDTMKELPATLLLRPFGLQTLATRVYELAALERFEEAALSALLIVLVGLVPVILVDRAVIRRRQTPVAPQ